MPGLATHWAVGKDNKTVFFKLDPKARWSDGKPVTSADFTFMLEFMRSKHITAPWYNHHFKEEIDDIKALTPWVVAVSTKKPHPRKLLFSYTAMTPVPKHFHKLDKDWVKNYNWKIEPNTGPYMITEFKKGKNVVFTRKKNWWAADRRFYKNRFNVDRVIVKVIRDINSQWEHFKKGQLEEFGLTLPKYWHDKAKGELFDNGYIKKLWFYTDSGQPIYGIWLNTAREIWKDKNVRYAFAHSINVGKVINQVLRGDYERLNTIHHGYGPYSNYDIKARTYDPAKVAELMKKSGWVRGADGIYKKGNQKFEVELTHGSAHHNDRLVVIQEDAKKAGVSIKIKQLDASAAFKAMREKKHDVAWTGWSGGGFIPAYRQFYHSENANKPQNNNFSNTSDPEIDKMIQEYRDTFDEVKKAEISRKLQAAIHDEGSTITTFLVPYFRIAYWRYWRLPDVPATKTSGSAFDIFSPGSGGLFWLDKKLKEETISAKKKNKSFGKSVEINDKYKI